MGNVNMRDMFKRMQAQMLTTLELGRTQIIHNGEMGEAAEESWRKGLESTCRKDIAWIRRS